MKFEPIRGRILPRRRRIGIFLALLVQLKRYRASWVIDQVPVRRCSTTSPMDILNRSSSPELKCLLSLNSRSNCYSSPHSAGWVANYTTLRSC
jgi:hypothetical protein